MPPRKRLRSTPSLLGDRHQNGTPSIIPQHESFEAIHDHEPSQTSADEVDADGGESSGSEGVGIQSSDGTQDLEDYNDSENDSENDVGGGSLLGQQLAMEQDDVAMIDEPTSDGSTPWLDYLHNTDNPYSPVLPFGLQLAHTSSLSTSPINENPTSDEDIGGVSINDPPSSDESLQPEWDVQHLGDYNFASPDQYTPFEPLNDLIIPPMQHPGSHSGSPSSSNPPQPALPFGMMDASATTTTTHPPGTNEGSEPQISAPLPQVDFDTPYMPSNTNYMILGSENVGLVDFLRRWAHTEPPKNLSPDIRQVYLQARRTVEEIKYEDLRGDHYDFQGLNWDAMGIPRTVARAQRRKTYTNYVNKPGSDRWSGERRELWVGNTENYFRFRKSVIRSDINLAHFQLRSVLATPSRVQAFYPTSKGICGLNPLTRKSEVVFDLGEFSAFNRAITTLDAACGVLVAGTFGGNYIIKSLHGQYSKKQSEGTITNPMCGITNHLQVHSQRHGGSPVAAISSNDRGFRVLDIETEQFISDFMYHFPLNCSAVSPDRRLRVLVGDSKDVAITNVETGETEIELSGHRDYGFSCDWSDDGFTVATGFQDKSVKIWDARKWTNSNREPTPTSVWCEMAGTRNLKFSPLGSGEQVLVSAEEADFINIFNAKRGDPNGTHDAENPEAFQSKQTIDIFGEIGGVSFGDEGHELNVLVSDPHRGGLMQFERATLGGRKPTMIESVPIF